MNDAQKFKPEVKVTFIGPDGYQHVYYPLGETLRTGEGLNTLERKLAALMLREALENLEYVDD